MGDFTIEEMLAMQQALQEKYKDKWELIGPEAGKHKLLWMLGEVGEVIDIIKKNGAKLLLRMQRYGSILWKKWRMCSCITTMSFCVMESVGGN